MKNIFLIVISCLCLGWIYGQTVPEGTRHIKYIDAVIYNGSDTSEYNQTVTYLDSTWKVLTNTNTLESAFTKGSYRVKVVDNERKKMYSDIDVNGDTLSSIAYLYDEEGNQKSYFQIRDNDTVVRQKRTYDKKGNNITLWNYEDDHYFLAFKATYDDSNHVIERVHFDSNGRIIETETFKRNYKKGTIKEYEQIPGRGRTKISETQIIDGVSKSMILRAREGINYGITLKWEKGGYTLKKMKNNNLVWMEIYDPSGNLSISVRVSYKKHQP